MIATLTLLAKALRQGRSLRCNLTEHTITCHGTVIKPGTTLRPVTKEESLRLIEEAYEAFRHSMPSSRGGDYPFLALPEEELSPDDIAAGVERHSAEALLEATVILATLSGSLHYDDLAQDGWFWQSPRQKRLVLLKKWFIS